MTAADFADEHDDDPDKDDLPETLPLTFTLAVVSCWIGAVGYAFIAIALGPAVGGMTWLMSLDGKGSPEDMQVAVVTEWMMLVMCGGFAFFNAVGAYGFSKRTKWGWVMALILAVIYTPSICFPFGLVILLACLNADVRKVCGF